MAGNAKSSPAKFELRGVSKSFAQSMALHPLDLRIESGRTTVFIGPSGCGKSTLLRMLIGLIRPTSGEILFDTRPLAPADLISLRRRMGYVIQEGGLFPHLTAAENVVIMARHLKMEGQSLDRRLRELCELTAFPEGALHQFPNELSGGQRQRVSLMRALMLRPEVLLLDEPLAALDPMVRAALQDDLKRIIAEVGQTAILVTHDMAEAAYLGDVIILLREGRVVQTGTLDDLRLRPASAFVGEFLRAQRSLTI